VQKNFHKIKGGAREENEIGKLKSELKKRRRLGRLKEVLKEEKKIEYMLFDLLKDGATNKDKLKRIKLICEE
jgi:hypothetical protein